MNHHHQASSLQGDHVPTAAAAATSSSSSSSASSTLLNDNATLFQQVLHNQFELKISFRLADLAAAAAAADPWTLTLVTLVTTLCLYLWLTRRRAPKDQSPHHASSRERLLYQAEEDAAALSRQNRRRLASYPPGYPEGWYQLCFSSELKVGEVKYTECCGVELAVYRGEDGACRTVDAYCPHLGANLGFGGKVVGNCIQCPFHLWEFDGKDGSCTKIPYCEPIPEVAKTRSWVTVEYHGFVCFYYGATEERRLNPPYELKTIPGILAGEKVHRGSKTFHVNMHLQEFAENSVDFQHFQPLHGGMVVPFTDIPLPFIQIKHVAAWDDNTGESHVVRFLDQATLMFRGKEIPHSSAHACITFQGPGGVVIFNFDTELGNIVLFQAHTPLERCKLRVSFSWFADKNIPRVLVAYVVGNWISQWKRDVMVWENKVYLRKPLLVKGDGPVMKLRRWFAQFYPEEVPTTEW